MPVTYDQGKKLFKLDTPNSTYIIGVLDKEQFVTHLYYGKYIPDMDLSYLFTPIINSLPSKKEGQRVAFMDAIPLEYPTYGIGDFRDHCLEVESSKGHHACSLSYESHRIYQGKPKIPALPATFAGEKECTTLELSCRDHILNLNIVLRYSVYEDLDVITKSVIVVNQAATPIYLKRILSGCLEFFGWDYDIVTLHGSWARECQFYRVPVTANKVITDSNRGESSAQSSPMMAILSKDANEDHGEVYGMNLVYSGNFYGCVEGHHNLGTRAVMGIHPGSFSWKLNAGEAFYAPELVCVYSAEGLGQMTRTFHDLYRKHLIRSPYKEKERPILVNNWEATYFDFDEKKLLELAGEARECGIEMLVLDDGWFGERTRDDRGLGDWTVNEEKLKGGLGKLSSDINALGMKFGLWIEPEMVNPNSRLFRAHPDWAIQIPGRACTLSRTQLVLDWSRKEVRDGVYDQIKKVLDHANVEYIKWDMNRHLTELGSFGLAADQQQELSHRYVLGVYEIMQRLITDFPNLLYENCSSGGGRFDPGVLYYSPQIWTSDDSDAIERIRIQAGTSLCYPLSTMGAHVSAVPNHQTGRITPMETRGIIALFGTFGYELDITKLSEEEKAIIKDQTARYHKYHHIVRDGDLYRISDVFHPGDDACWSVVSKDKKEALLAYVQIQSRPGSQVFKKKIRWKGLDPDALYEIAEHIYDQEHARIPYAEDENDREEKLVLSGAVLMNAGIWMKHSFADYTAQLIYIRKYDG